MKGAARPFFGLTHRGRLPLSLLGIDVGADFGLNVRMIHEGNP